MMRAKHRETQYSEHDCGGSEVCSGCSSWRHGVYEDGSGDEAALLVMRRVRRRERDPYVSAQRRENLLGLQAAEGRGPTTLRR